MGMSTHREGGTPRFALLIPTLAAVAIAALFSGSAGAVAVSTVSLHGGSGTLTSGGMIYSAAAGAIGVDVATSADTACVTLFDNGVRLASQTAAGGAATWHFDIAAPPVNGVRQIRATAFATGDCHGAWGSGWTSLIVDNAGPRIFSLVSPMPNAAGWNRTNVRVDERANDGGMAGVLAASLTPRLTLLTDETPGTTVAATAQDRLGNVGSGTVVVRIDKTVPTVWVNDVANGGTYVVGNVPAPTCGASDSLSGIASCNGALHGGLANGVGHFTYDVDAADHADNSASAHTGFDVVYRFTPSGVPSIVPVGKPAVFRFQLMRADGTVVQASSAPTLIGGTGTVQWNATSHRYVVSETVAGAHGDHATMGIRLDDGTSHTFVVTLG
jgi:hypothetical protein